MSALDEVLEHWFIGAEAHHHVTGEAARAELVTLRAELAASQAEVARLRDSISTFSSTLKAIGYSLHYTGSSGFRQCWNLSSAMRQVIDIAPAMHLDCGHVLTSACTSPSGDVVCSECGRVLA